MKKSKYFSCMLVVVLMSVTSSLSASESVVGELFGGVITQDSLLLVGTVSDCKAELTGIGFVSGTLTRDGEVVHLLQVEVSGRFSLSYSLQGYQGWDWSVTLYSYEVDADGTNRVLKTSNGKILNL